MLYIIESRGLTITEFDKIFEIFGSLFDVINLGLQTFFFVLKVGRPSKIYLAIRKY